MTIIQYIYDPSSASTDNLVVNELHNVLDSTARIIVARHGLFYAKSLLVVNTQTGLPLIYLTDYRLVSLDPWITEKSGYECCAGVEILANSISGNIEITYQAVGGKEGYYSALVKELSDRIKSLSERDVSWQDILNRPIEFPPEPHPHEILTDLTGLQALRNTFEGLKDTLTNRRGPVFSGFDINSKLERLLALLSELNKTLNLLGLAKSKIATAIDYGLVRLATPLDVVNSSIGDKVITSETLDFKVADTVRKGLIKIATLATVLLRQADDEAVTPKTLGAILDNDSTISLNKKVINNNYTMDSSYNGESIGTIIISDDSIVKIGDSSLWVIEEEGYDSIPKIKNNIIKITSNTRYYIISYSWVQVPDLKITFTAEADSLMLMSSRINVRYIAATWGSSFRCIINGGIYTNHLMSITAYEPSGNEDGYVDCILEDNLLVSSGISYTVEVQVMLQIGKLPMVPNEIHCINIGNLLSVDYTAIPTKLALTFIQI